MRLFQGPGLPSDQIRVRVGFEGTEPDEILSRSPQAESSRTRVAVVINTFHPKIEGGYYLNRSLIGLIQDVLGDLGLHVVWNEAFGSAEIVPVEERSSLQLDEDYLLVDDKLETKGNVFLWRYAVAGGGAFYSDDVVVDIRVAEGMALRFRSRLEIRCKQAGVALVGV